MTSKFSYLNRTASLFLFALIICACNPAQGTANLEPVPITRDSPIQISPTPISTITPTPLPTVVESHQPATPPPTLEWTPELEQLKLMLLGTTCSAPCWFGIQLGVTTPNQAQEIIEQQIEAGVIESFYLKDHPTGGKSYEINFTAISEFSGAGIGYDENRNHVTALSIGSEAKFILLQDVINVYGPPDLVSGGMDDSYHLIYLAYEQPEIFIRVRSDYLIDTTLSPDMSVKLLWFLSPHVNNHPLTSTLVTWVNWEGFQDFEYYYQKIRGARENQDSLPTGISQQLQHRNYIPQSLSSFIKAAFPFPLQLLRIP